MQRVQPVLFVYTTQTQCAWSILILFYGHEEIRERGASTVDTGNAVTCDLLCFYNADVDEWTLHHRPIQIWWFIILIYANAMAPSTEYRIHAHLLCEKFNTFLNEVTIALRSMEWCFTPSPLTSNAWSRLLFHNCGDVRYPIRNSNTNATASHFINKMWKTESLRQFWRRYFPSIQIASTSTCIVDYWPHLTNSIRMKKQINK